MSTTHACLDVLIAGPPPVQSVADRAGVALHRVGEADPEHLARVGEALMGLRRVCAQVRFLGSYPRVDGVSPTVRRGVADEEFRDAQAWLARVREGRE